MLPTEELTAIPAIGDKIAASVREYFSDPENLALIQRLKDAGIAMTEDQTASPAASENPLAGKTVVITGTLIA